MHAHTPPPSQELLADLVDDVLTPAEVCRRHALTMLDLAAVVDTDEFRRVSAAVARVHAARAAAVLARLQARALHALAEIIAQTPTTPAHTETLRKAVSALLRFKPPSPPQPAVPATTDAPDSAETPTASNLAPPAPSGQSPVPSPANNPPACVPASSSRSSSRPPPKPRSVRALTESMRSSASLSSSP